MSSKLIAGFLLVFSLPVFAENNKQGEYNGQFVSGETPKVWSQTSNSWTSPKAFWLEYADTKGGLTWGERNDYPVYDQVNEYDTMIIQLETGECMMEFFHNRWRRANDVRRWDPLFNEFSGCPDVFK